MSKESRRRANWYYLLNNGVSGATAEVANLRADSTAHKADTTALTADQNNVEE